LIAIFEECVENIIDLIPDKYIFLLTDCDGILLKKKGKRRTRKNDDLGIEEGMSFSEESSGTNAISIAIRLKKPIFILPMQNYCNFLRNFYFYAAPLWSCKQTICLAVAAEEQDVKKEMMAVLELLVYQIANELKKNTASRSIAFNNAGINLNDKQVTVLKLISKGFTDKAVAIDMGLSIDTVRYHKRVIFKRLDAGSSAEAIVKALKLNLIAMEQIGL
jgi:transcriptional regulator of acetoin/glycerol metabolism